MEEESEEVLGTVLEHFYALRSTLIHCFLIFLCGFFVVYPFSEAIFKVISRPLLTEKPLEAWVMRQEKVHNHGQSVIQWSPPIGYSKLVALSEAVELSPTLYQISPGGSLIFEAWVPKQRLQILNPIEGFLVTLKLSFWLGLFLSSPFWLKRVLHFFWPALRTSEKQLILPLLGLSYLALVLGALTTYYGTLPAANAYFYAFNESLGDNAWSLSYYMQFALWLFCANMISCECAVIGLLLVHKEWITYEHLKGKRRFAILGAFILAALITPPDVLTQFLVALPLIGLYEVMVLYAKSKRMSQL